MRGRTIVKNTFHWHQKDSSLDQVIDYCTVNHTSSHTLYFLAGTIKSSRFLFYFEVSSDLPVIPDDFPFLAHQLCLDPCSMFSYSSVLIVPFFPFLGWIIALVGVHFMSSHVCGFCPFSMLLFPLCLIVFCSPLWKTLSFVLVFFMKKKESCFVAKSCLRSSCHATDVCCISYTSAFKKSALVAVLK